VIALAAGLCAAAILGGLLMIVLGVRPHHDIAGGAGAPPSVWAGRTRRLLRALHSLDAPAGLDSQDSHAAGRRRLTVLLALAGGLLGWLLTGLALLVIAVPVAVVGLPRLLSAPGSAASIDRLEGLEEWTRNLAGVLAVGVGLEQAITASLRSTPQAIRPQVSTLVARLAARWNTPAALRAFADDLDDATGDLVAASLILSAQRRGAGLIAVLDGLAGSVAEDVRTRRAIEADRAKPRSTARAVTFITLGVLVLLSLNKTYVEPYTSGLGQVLLAVLLIAYVGALLWMRQMTAGRPAPRLFAATTGRLASPPAGTAAALTTMPRPPRQRSGSPTGTR